MDLVSEIIVISWKEILAMMVMTFNLMAAELTWLPNLSQSDMRTSHLSAPLIANSAKAEPMKLAFGARPVWFWVFWRRK